MRTGYQPENFSGTDEYRVPARKKFLGTDGYWVPVKFSTIPTPAQAPNFLAVHVSVAPDLVKTVKVRSDDFENLLNLSYMNYG